MPNSASAPRRSSAREILTSLGEAVYEWTARNDALSWGANAPEVLGVAGFEPIATGALYRSLVAADCGETRENAIALGANTDVGRGVLFRTEYALKPRGEDGPVVWIEDTGRWFADERGKLERVHGVVRLAGERRERESRIADIAGRDALTGQLDRSHLIAALTETLAAIAATRRQAAFLVATVEGLDGINESFGLDAGGAALAEVARRIRSQLRAGDVIGRYSGNMLGVLVMNCGEKAMAAAGERFAAAARAGIVETRHGPISMAVTIGGVVLSRQAQDPEEAMLGAEAALRRARTEKPGGFVGLAAGVVKPGAADARVAQSLVAALNEGRIVLMAEPVLSSATGTAALRVEPAVSIPSGDTLTALDFARAAERAGVAYLVDRRSLDLAVAELEADPALRLRLALSAAAVVDPRWREAARAVFLRRPEAGRRLTVEIGADLLVRYPGPCAAFAAAMAELGIGTGVTGFGAGTLPLETIGRLAPTLVELAPSVTAGAGGAGAEPRLAALIALAGLAGDAIAAAEVTDPAQALALREAGVAMLRGPVAGQPTVRTPIAAPAVEVRGGNGKPQSA